MIEIEKILKEERVLTLFQPIVSVKKKSLVGFEGLSRGYGDSPTDLIPYQSMYEEAKKKGLLVEFDRLCRKKALESFVQQLGTTSPYMLFLNFDVSILDQGVLGSFRLRSLVEELGISPSRVVIELIETEITDIENLRSFVFEYRKEGFLFALDDFGERFSNIERLAVIKPDIIKVAKTVFKSNRIGEEYRGSLLSGLSSMIARIGSIPLVEGIEYESELLEGVDTGFDFYQGFLFAKPFRDITADLIDQLQTKIHSLSLSCFTHRLENIQNKRSFHKTLLEEARGLAQLVENQSQHVDVDLFLKSLISESDTIQCAYLLNRNGTQVSETLFRSPLTVNPGTLYQPAHSGTDHSEKEYYMHIVSGSKQYFSAPYISYATGKFCVTISLLLEKGWFKEHILCLDFEVRRETAFA